MRILYDIGANKGLYTDTLIDKYDKCILVEANPVLCEYLQGKYSNNTKIKIVNVIVSKDENVQFYVSNADTLSTADISWITDSRFTKDYSWKAIDGVSTMSLDSIIRQEGTPSFIKIDVEGYELNVVKSLTQKYSGLCFEWAEEKKEEIIQTIEYLSEIGYSQFAIQNKDDYNYSVPNEDWTTKEKIILYCNSFFDTKRRSEWGMIWAL